MDVFLGFVAFWIAVLTVGTILYLIVEALLRAAKAAWKRALLWVTGGSDFGPDQDTPPCWFCGFEGYAGYCSECGVSEEDRPTADHLFMQAPNFKLELVPAAPATSLKACKFCQDVGPCRYCQPGAPDYCSTCKALNGGE